MKTSVHRQLAQLLALATLAEAAASAARAIRTPDAPTAPKSLGELLAELPELSVGLRQTARFECELRAPAAQLVWLRLNRSEEVQLLSLNQRLIAPDKRLRVGRLSPLRWQLELAPVAQEDSGAHFLCQASCAPNGGQTCEGPQRFAGGARLNVLAPPRFVANRTSASLVAAPEWRPLELGCVVEAEPRSQVAWKREDGRPLDELGLELRLGHELGAGKLELDSASLVFGNFTRRQAGAYLNPKCIASNGVQPGVSQRVQVEAVRCRATAEAQQEEACAGRAEPDTTDGTTATAAAAAAATQRPRQAWRPRTGEKRRPTAGSTRRAPVSIRPTETNGARRPPLISATLLAALTAISVRAVARPRPL